MALGSREWPVGTFAQINLYYELRATFEFEVLYTIQCKCLQYILMVMEKRGLQIDTFAALRTYRHFTFTTSPTSFGDRGSG